MGLGKRRGARGRTSSSENRRDRESLKGQKGKGDATLRRGGLVLREKEVTRVGKNLESFPGKKKHLEGKERPKRKRSNHVPQGVRRGSGGKVAVLPVPGERPFVKRKRGQ